LKLAAVLKSVIPIPGTSMSVSNCDHLNYRRQVPINDSEWGMLEHEPAGALRADRPTVRRFDNRADGPRPDQVRRQISLLRTSCVQSTTQMRPHIRIPLLRETQLSCRPCESLEEIRARISSQGTVFGLPESRSAMRRAISWFQASSAPASTAVSKLYRRDPAKAARSSSERSSAFCNSSRACRVMSQL
jgi:hypothetical protein